MDILIHGWHLLAPYTCVKCGMQIFILKLDLRMMSAKKVIVFAITKECKHI